MPVQQNKVSLMDGLKLNRTLLISASESLIAVSHWCCLSEILKCDEETGISNGGGIFSGVPGSMGIRCHNRLVSDIEGVHAKTEFDITFIHRSKGKRIAGIGHYYHMVRLSSFNPAISGFKSLDCGGKEYV